MLQPGPLEPPEAIDKYTEALARELARIVDLVAPPQRPGRRSNFGWDHDAKQAVEEERRAQRAWLSDRTETVWRALQQACSEKKTTREAKAAAWRNPLYEASGKPAGVWNIARWAGTERAAPPLRQPCP